MIRNIVFEQFVVTAFVYSNYAVATNKDKSGYWLLFNSSFWGWQVTSPDGLLESSILEVGKDALSRFEGELKPMQFKENIGTGSGEWDELSLNFLQDRFNTSIFNGQEISTIWAPNGLAVAAGPEKKNFYALKLTNGKWEIDKFLCETEEHEFTSAIKAFKNNQEEFKPLLILGKCYWSPDFNSNVVEL